MIVFENRGEIDIAAMTTFGVSVKVGDNPIGYFGTGLKYAIAVLLRTGHRVTVHSGEDELRFSTRRGNVRGKDFEFVEMSTNGREPASIGFTTELGKNWEPWMAYRELYCNTRDEGGEVYACASGSAATDPRRDLTQIRVKGDDIERVHGEHDQYFVEGEPDLIVNRIGIYRRPSTALFYRGVRVLTLPKPAVFTYNLLDRIELTEDRTMAHPFMAEYYLRRALAKCTEPEILEAALTATSDEFERDFAYHRDSEKPSQEFIDTVGRLADVAGGALVPGAISAWNAHKQRIFTPSKTPLSAYQRDALRRVKQRAARVWPDLHPILVVDSVPDGARGIFADGSICIAAATLGDEETMLRTVLDQHVQARCADDVFVEPADMMLDALVRLVGDVAAEPVRVVAPGCDRVVREAAE